MIKNGAESSDPPKNPRILKGFPIPMVQKSKKFYKVGGLDPVISGLTTGPYKFSRKSVGLPGVKIHPTSRGPMYNSIYFPTVVRWPIL